MHLARRLGLNVHRDQWPTTALLKSYEAAGFGWVQVHTPPRAALTQREPALRHARSLRAALEPCGLRLVLHGPDDLLCGSPDGDRQAAALLDHAAEAGAELVVLHGMAIPLSADGLHERLRREEASLRRLAARAHALGLVVAVENLAPVWPGPHRACHDARAVRDLVRRIDLPGLGLLLDIGHANIMCSLRRESLADLVRDCIDDVVLLHVHDNLGARANDLDQQGIDPVKLDLHLPPGAGCLPWDAVAPLLAEHGAPLVLEIERSHLRDPGQAHLAAIRALGRGALV